MKLELTVEGDVQIIMISNGITSKEVKIVKAGMRKIFETGKNKIILEVNSSETLPYEVVRDIGVLSNLARDYSGRIVVVTSNELLKNKLAYFAKPPMFICCKDRQSAIASFTATVEPKKEPVESTRVIDPPKPAEESSGSVKSVDPLKSAEESKEPVKYSDTLKPVEESRGPVKSLDPLKPIEESTNPLKLLDPLKPMDVPKGPVKSIDTPKPVEEPEGSVKSLDPLKYTDAKGSMKTVSSPMFTKTGKLLDLENPVKATEPVKFGKPTEPAKFGKPTEPAKFGKPTEPAKSAKPSEPIKPLKSLKSLRSSPKPVASIEPVKPVEPVETEEFIEPVEPPLTKDEFLIRELGELGTVRRALAEMKRENEILHDRLLKLVENRREAGDAAQSDKIRALELEVEKLLSEVAKLRRGEQYI